MSTMKLTIIGYWESSDVPDFPHPAGLIDADWAKDERAELVRYLKTGERLNEWLGYSHCRFADGPPDEEMGNADLTDGVWLWPEGLSIYVERYLIRLPNEFLDHARANGFQVPNNLNRLALYRAQRDLSFWKAWAIKNVRPRGL